MVSKKSITRISFPTSEYMVLLIFIAEKYYTKWKGGFENFVLKMG